MQKKEVMLVLLFPLFDVSVSSLRFLKGSIDDIPQVNMLQLKDEIRLPVTGHTSSNDDSAEYNSYYGGDCD
jgi:hypothetical protein